MVNVVIYALIGVVAGLHAACYGAYKDSLYESFKLNRFLREIFIATSIAILLAVFGIGSQERLFVMFLVFFAGSRAVTEAYKLFFRVESQKQYLIPSQVHFFKKVVHNRFARIGIGLFALFVLSSIFILGELITPLLPTQGKGMLLGFLIGSFIAIGGSYKDAMFEGFEPLKFLRSPLLGLIGGTLLSTQTTSTFFIILGSIGVERMIVEMRKGFLQKGYSPGKFKAKKPKYPEWVEKRKQLIMPYLFTWAVFLCLVII